VDVRYGHSEAAVRIGTSRLQARAQHISCGDLSFNGNTSKKDKMMRQFLAVAGPIFATFVLWSVITVIPMYAILMFVLVVASGVLMLSSIVYFRKIADKGR
jgi:hypothetical protein